MNPYQIEENIRYEHFLKIEQINWILSFSLKSIHLETIMKWNGNITKTYEREEKTYAKFPHHKNLTNQSWAI